MIQKPSKWPDFDLGIHDLENELKEIRYPELNRKWKGNYLMGCGREVQNPNDATDLFLKREFKAIADCEDLPHPPVFVPDIFVFKYLNGKVRNIFFIYIFRL